MLLPLAQIAANWHAQSHWDNERSGSTKDLLASAHCGVCLSAAAVTGGGAASTAPVVLHAPARHYVAPLVAGLRWSAPLLQAYQSRAPPLSFR